jgi:phage terminase small subunit
MGRPRKPVEARILDGTYKPSRHGPPPDAGDEVAPPAKPADLDGDAAVLWDTIVPMLATVARERDAPMLAELCWQWAELRRIKAVIAKKKPGAKGYNQLLVAAGICTDKFEKIASRFGLTPSDRAKLGVVQAGPVRAKVATRQPTALDRAGGPKAEQKKGPK